MVVVDANVLLYAVDLASAHHELSLSWLDTALAGAETVGLAWVALLAFVRVATSATIFPTPLTTDEATGQVEGWLAAPAAVVAHPRPGMPTCFADCCATPEPVEISRPTPTWPPLP